ncbi:hypothetical protein RchiOBHm_Chr3g0450071 [Rosa chinensis]|uniref:Uncharacterized protein n=1 Tax=Rosa chinensis TaxID=74649 RepID=A0A2P6R5N7_ROSCH|nr:hypothetical protein RchiOBHm_Chr3g0450071 [Rosa chinensis]
MNYSAILDSIQLSSSYPRSIFSLEKTPPFPPLKPPSPPLKPPFPPLQSPFPPSFNTTINLRDSKFHFSYQYQELGARRMR